MLHLPYNLKLIRELSETTQPVFGRKFSASKAMIVSYEKGKAAPGDLFLSRVAEAAGITQEMLGNKKLAERDIQVEKLKKVFHGKMDSSSTELMLEEAGPVYKAMALPEKIILNLSESIKIQAIANKEQAIANREQAEANNKSTAQNGILMQSVKPTADGALQIPVNVSASISDFLELIAAIGSGERIWKSKEEGLSVLNKFVPVPGAQADKKDTRVRSGKGNRQV